MIRVEETEMNEQKQPKRKKQRVKKKQNMQPTYAENRPRKKRPVSSSRKKKSLKKTLKKIGGKVLRSLKQKETIWLLVLLTVIVLFFLRFSTHRVDGQSMEPTFQTNDRILISPSNTLSRYAVVTFEPKNIKNESYVKRIIGMPGDRIQLMGNALFLLPKENEKKEKVDLTTEVPDGTIKIMVSEAVMNQLHQYERIPKDRYFVQGDNRLHSDDSRVFGLIDKAQIEGVVLYRYYPFSKMGIVH